MHTTIQKRKQEGFTIIEVLIVLAIAGLIMLIVFLAVPALQRNSRNTAMRNDVQNVLGGLAEFTGANDGAIPTKITSDANGDVKYESTGKSSTSIKVQGATTVTSEGAKIGLPLAANATGPENGTIQINIGVGCDGNANKRMIAAVYSIETTTNMQTARCSES